MTTPLIQVTHLKTRFGHQWIHTDVSFQVDPGEIIVIIGGSGSGKTVLIRQLLCLMQPSAGSIRIFNQELTQLPPTQLLQIQRRWGVLFQQNALFSSLTVLENVSFPLSEQTSLSAGLIRELALLKISLAGLPLDVAHKYPAELSGGMAKRAALARAIATDPELLFLDEPTAGLDPGNVVKFDELMLNLQKMLGLTLVMVTHDVESLKRVANRVIFLGEGKVLSMGTPQAVMNDPHPLIQKFFEVAGEVHGH